MTDKEVSKPRKLKSELSEEVIESIIQKISDGIPYLYACEASGIEESTFYRWRKEAEGIQKRISDSRDSSEKEEVLSKREKLLIQFIKSLKEARAKAIARNVTIINTAAKDQWQAAAWWLERMAHEDFGRKDKHELAHTGNVSGTLTLAARDIEKMSLDERIEYARALRAKMNLIEAPLIEKIKEEE